jgi:hypothetical protein
MSVLVATATGVAAVMARSAVCAMVDWTARQAGPLTVPGARAMRPMLPTPNGRGAGGQHGRCQSNQYAESSHQSGWLIASEAVRPISAQKPNFPTIELADAALASSGTCSNSSVVRNSE